MYNNIAIYWWAFNPPTLWHINVIEQVFLNSDISQIIIVPDWIRLDKWYNINEIHRKRMIEIFINELQKKWFNIDVDYYFFEWKNNSDTTTYEVDNYFKKKFKKQVWHIFWTDISNWIKYWSWNPNKYIQKKLRKIFVPRDWAIFSNYDLENYILIETKKVLDISSTKVKERIKEKKKISDLVTEKIEKYILENNLYK